MHLPNRKAKEEKSKIQRNIIFRMTVLMKLYYSRADSCSTVLEKCKKSEINSGNRAQVLGPTKLGFSKKPGVSDQTLSMSRLLRFARKKTVFSSSQVCYT